MKPVCLVNFGTGLPSYFKGMNMTFFAKGVSFILCFEMAQNTRVTEYNLDLFSLYKIK